MSRSLSNKTHPNTPRPPSFWARFWGSFLLFLAPKLYHTSPPSSLPEPDYAFRIICISDTHNGHDAVPSLPDGDVLIHAGDLTEGGTRQELRDALNWLNRQPHLYKIFIGGNHDYLLSDPTFQNEIEEKYSDLIYLQDSSVTITNFEGRSLKVYGSPHTPKLGSSSPFRYPPIPFSEVSYSARWSDIPADTDILITHGPPSHHLDYKKGCPALLDTLWTVKPKLHVFGHVHVGRGVERVLWTEDQRKYERIMSSMGGWLDLFALLRGALLWFLWPSKWQRSREGEVGVGQEHTVLVNASSMIDRSKPGRRSAIVVDI